MLCVYVSRDEGADVFANRKRTDKVVSGVSLAQLGEAREPFCP